MSASMTTAFRTTTSHRSPWTALKSVSRSARLAILLGLAGAATLAATALPASADSINLAKTMSVAGTNCTVTVGTDYNTYAYPGTATQVSCPTRHNTTVTTQLQVVSTAGGNWGLYGQTPTSAYTNAFGTRMMLYYWPQCPAGRWQWRVVAFVTIDGVYRGSYANDPHTWTACTTS
jgi:hypothetical protein